MTVEDVMPGMNRVLGKDLELELMDVAFERERNGYGMTQQEFAEFASCYAILSDKPIPPRGLRMVALPLLGSVSECEFVLLLRTVQ